MAQRPQPTHWVGSTSALAADARMGGCEMDGADGKFTTVENSAAQAGKCLMDNLVSLFEKHVEYNCSDILVSQHDSCIILAPCHINTLFDDYITRNSTSTLGATLSFKLGMGSDRIWELVLPNYLF